jgi:hypothetical protein
MQFGHNHRIHGVMVQLHGWELAFYGLRQLMGWTVELLSLHSIGRIKDSGVCGYQYMRYLDPSHKSCLL